MNDLSGLIIGDMIFFADDEREGRALRSLLIGLALEITYMESPIVPEDHLIAQINIARDNALNAIVVVYDGFTATELKDAFHLFNNSDNHKTPIEAKDIRLTMAAVEFYTKGLNYIAPIGRVS